MIICFEGPSAVGKTTMCQALKPTFSIIPEVNLLFEKPKNAGRFWYYKKQVERYQLALSTKGNAILDGDIFQPFWYNWIYGFPENFPNFEETIDFYLNAAKKTLIQFPDLYIVFTTTIESLIERKQKDPTRTRRNFEKHLKLIAPQKQYFQFLKQELKIPVSFISNTNFESTKLQVIQAIQSTEKNSLKAETIIKQIHIWLQEIQPIKDLV